MFAILFGPSMDYEVFRLSRIRERYLATGDSDASVIEGLGGTARVITRRPLIMIAVFLGLSSATTRGSRCSAPGSDGDLRRRHGRAARARAGDQRLLGDANWWFPRLGGQRRVTSPSATAQSNVRANVSATGVYESPSPRSAGEPS